MIYYLPEADSNATPDPVTKFLHIADIHLGVRRYKSEERAIDFFQAWRDCIERYALAERVSFVLIAGDLFDSPRVDPQAMNHAMYSLMKLRDAGIPVVVIEGNHDKRETVNHFASANRFSWHRTFSQCGFIKLLAPFYDENCAVRCEPWDPRQSFSIEDAELRWRFLAAGCRRERSRQRRLRG